MRGKSFEVKAANPAEAAKRDLEARQVAVKWLKESLKRQGRKLPVSDELLDRADLSKLGTGK
jgi:hypothetical protein